MKINYKQRNSEPANITDDFTRR